MLWLLPPALRLVQAEGRLIYRELDCVGLQHRESNQACCSASHLLQAEVGTPTDEAPGCGGLQLMVDISSCAGLRPQVLAPFPRCQREEIALPAVPQSCTPANTLQMQAVGGIDCCFAT